MDDRYPEDDIFITKIFGGDRYDVSWPYMRRTKRCWTRAEANSVRRKWLRELRGPPPELKPGQTKTNRILELYDDGMVKADIAREMRIKYQFVNNVINKHRKEQNNADNN